jgi:hypothetical protein
MSIAGAGRRNIATQSAIVTLRQAAQAFATTSS